MLVIMGGAGFGLVASADGEVASPVNLWQFVWMSCSRR